MCVPLADVCQLDYTDFAEGLRVDIAAYWKSALEIARWPNDKYIQTEWDDLDYARVALFGQL